MLYCNQRIETMPREAMRRMQAEKLRKTVEWAREKSAFYSREMARAGVTDAQISALDDLKKLPFTTKAQLAEASPFDFLTGPLSGALRVRMTSESPAVTRAYTGGDIGLNAEMMARCLVAGGVHRASVLQIVLPCMNEDAMATQYAGEAIGATVVPADPQRPELCARQIDSLGVTALATEADSLPRLLDAGQTTRLAGKEGNLSSIFLFHRELAGPKKERAAERTGARVFHLYAPPEIGSPGMLFDCGQTSGMHVQEDYFYPEVIDPASLAVIGEGRVGELVLTALAAEAMPLIRYRTGQMVSLERSACACGRTLVRVKAP